VSKLLEKQGKLIRTIKEHTTGVFDTMLGVTITATEVTQTSNFTAENAGVVAMVGVAGAVSGSGSLCMSNRFACFSASRFLLAEYDSVTDEVLDAVAELANMIVGGMKTALEEELGPMGLSIPIIVCGNHYVTRSSSLGDRMIIRFSCNEEGIDEQFTLVVNLISDNASRAYLRELAGFHARIS
jgi:chemotaxis protein CheX